MDQRSAQPRPSYEVGLWVASDRLTLAQICTLTGLEPGQGSGDRGAQDVLGRLRPGTIWKLHASDGTDAGTIDEQVEWLGRAMQPARIRAVRERDPGATVTLAIAAFSRMYTCMVVLPRSALALASAVDAEIMVVTYPVDDHEETDGPDASPT